MIWLALEVVLGLALVAFIIWWTLPRKRPTERGEQRGREGKP